MGLIISDLGRPHDQSVVLDMLDNLRPISAHLGLPCGTCSRARDRPLPKELRSKFQAPPPLRDVDNLMGFPYLTGIHKTKVDAANALYIFAVSILKKCFTLGITVSIENPQRSWICAILLYLVRQQDDPAFLEWYAALEKVDFHSCTHGGRRPKKTRLLASPGLYTSLAQECNRSHKHLPWGVQQQGDSLFFSTAEEAEYPHLLCKRMAQCLVDHSALKGIPLSSPQSSSQRARNAWGSQTSNSRPLIAEFRDFVYPTEALDTPGYRLLASPPTGATNTEMQVEHAGEEDPTDLQATDEVEPTNKRRRQTYNHFSHQKQSIGAGATGRTIESLHGPKYSACSQDQKDMFVEVPFRNHLFFRYGGSRSCQGWNTSLWNPLEATEFPGGLETSFIVGHGTSGFGGLAQKDPDGKQRSLR